MKFVVLGGQSGIVEDITLSLHDRHGHIDSVYPTITGIVFCCYNCLDLP